MQHESISKRQALALHGLAEYAAITEVGEIIGIDAQSTVSSATGSSDLQTPLSWLFAIESVGMIIYFIPPLRIFCGFIIVSQPSRYQPT